MHSSFALILSVILVSSLFTMAAAVRPVPPDSKISLDDHTHFMPTDKSLDTNPVVRSPGGNSVSSPGTSGSTASCSNNRGGDGLGHFMLPERSLGYNSILRSPGISGSTAISSPSGDSLGQFILHKRSLAEIPIGSPGVDLPSPLPPSAYVIEMEPPSKPSPPTCRPRC